MVRQVKQIKALRTVLHRANAETSFRTIPSDSHCIWGDWHIPAINLSLPWSMKIRLLHIIPLLCLLLCGRLQAQVAPTPGTPPAPSQSPSSDSSSNRLEIISTELFFFGDFQGDKVRKLLGNVHLRQDSTDMFCDSAYHFVDSNYVIAFSNVKIVLSEATGREIRGDKLTYDGKTKILNIYDQVVLQDTSLTLTTDQLTYFREPDYGQYTTGGKIEDGENTLYSQTGYYYPGKDMTYFKKDVLLVNPDFLLETDTLGYNTEKEIAYFLAPTYVYDSVSSMYTEDGFYDTRKDVAYLFQNSQAGDTSYTLFADTIIYEENKDLGTAHGNVQIIESDSGLTLYGQYGQFRSKTEESLLTDQAFAIQQFSDDTLYLFADTLYSIKDSSLDQKIFHAYHQASFVMNALQGVCDTITYFYADSVLHFKGQPVLWSDSSQITGDTIILKMKDSDIDSMKIPRDAFLISQEDSVKFNQVKGVKMEARFDQGNIAEMFVHGNCESIYFSKDEEKNEYLGMNQATCNDMYIDFAENKPSKIYFKDQPKGTFSPMHEVITQPNKLDGFSWRVDERPDQPFWLYSILYPEQDSVLQRLDGMITDLGQQQSLLDSLFKIAPEELDDLSEKDDLTQDLAPSPLDSLEMEREVPKADSIQGLDTLNAAPVESDSVDTAGQGRGPKDRYAGLSNQEIEKLKRKEEKSRKQATRQRERAERKAKREHFTFKHFLAQFSAFFGLEGRQREEQRKTKSDHNHHH